MKYTLTLLFASLICFTTIAQRKIKKKEAIVEKPQSSIENVYKGKKWRNIGPYRGGRSIAVAGHKDQPYTYYFGAVGGGVWKTTDGGTNWNYISDSTFTSSSVGAIAVAPSDPNVVYVGMGEADMRSNISYGDGIYKSLDAGKTWKHMGLPKADAIATIQVHPQNSEVLYVASVGNPFAKNTERGVFRSTDGGDNWDHILAVNDSTGAYHVKLDPNNPRVLYATTWQASRNAFSMTSGGPGCGLHKSTDGGDTWKSLSQNPGMPKGMLGKIGIAVSPANSDRLYALIENANGGLYTSQDAGATWKLVNKDKNLWQRPWYYMNLEADPQNEEAVIILNVRAFKSTDGGKTTRRINVHHGDTHDIWINPNDGSNYIIGDDGGGEVTYNDGRTFSELDIATAQFYHVHVDNDFPYNIYGSQQDNSTIKISSRSDGYSIGPDNWKAVAGGESGYIAIDPDNSKITYGGSYDGFLTQYNEETNQRKMIMVYPENNMGHTSAQKKYRFQWTFPIMFSPHDNDRLYCTSQYVHVTEDEGHRWQIISPDLTRNDTTTTGNTGGPITLDQTGAEIYATIFALDESKLEKGNLWAGSDDGLIHVSRDNGQNWENVSISKAQLPDFALISTIHTSAFEKGKAYIAATRYMSGDKKPYLFKTSDYGKTWTDISAGIPMDQYTRVLREDPNKPGLLYAGTEQAVFVSFDDGASWKSLKLNLPITSIRDLQIQKREKDLVVATHGLSFWILDDLSPLYEIMDKKVSESSSLHLFTPRHAYRMGGGSYDGAADAVGTNAENGVLINYYLGEPLKEELRLQVLNAKGDTIITYSSKKDLKGKEIKESPDFYEDKETPQAQVLPAKKGLNHFVWNIRHANATEIKGEKSPMWAGSLRGPKVIPGAYSIKLFVKDSLVAETEANILKDPRGTANPDDFQKQYDLSLKAHGKLEESHQNINKIRDIRSAVNAYMKVVKDTAIVSKFEVLTKPLLKKLDELEGKLVQKKAIAVQDLLAYPIKLNDKMAGLVSTLSYADAKPTAASYLVYEDLSTKINATTKELNDIIANEVPAFNALVKENQLPAIGLEE